MARTSQQDEGALAPTDGVADANTESEVDDGSAVDDTRGAARGDSDELDQDVASKSRSAGVPLSSLTPQYEEQHHETYLRRLEEALKDPRNLNIALTGRYGAGKSSVLDEFENNHRKVTQRLSISTLAPDGANDTTTNRIQKEIVKQLLYGASHKVGKNSRFSRIAVLTKRRVFAESIGCAGAVGLVLLVFGLLPELDWPDADDAGWLRVAVWCVIGAVAAVVVAVVRVATYGWFVSDVSAGGATVTLTSKEASSTFFDKYLDEIVYYFDRESKDIVIFEDLDRFEDPGIFEAVRELNILLNDTPHRRARRRGNLLGRGFHKVLGWLPGDAPGWLIETLPAKWSQRLLGLGVPLRFVYAVKDSLFEKLGKDTRKVARAGDAAAAETLRANRTKFFNIVIPMVPFISHRNARELLSDLLDEAGITGIERPLVGLVSQSTTDMRLLRNICNEYLVFAERLLESKKTAPGLEPSKLFALVAYKNFHLEDFENISRRDSDLDRLYDFHQKLVRQSIADNEKRERDLNAGRTEIRTRVELAERLGQRLTQYAVLRHTVFSQQYGGRPHIVFKVGARTFQPDTVGRYEFWAAVADAGAIDIAAAASADGAAQARSMTVWDRPEMEVMVPEGLEANRWVGIDEETTRAEVTQLHDDVDRLRSADFDELASLSTYKLTVPEDQSSASVPGSGAFVERTFAEFVSETMKSPLARDLVLRGYIDRNFSLYAAQFYGHFSGADVANYMVHHVQTNSMNVDYSLKRPGAVANLLVEARAAGEDLTNTVAALNVDVVDYLLAHDDPGANGVVNRLVTEYDDDAHAFLTTYLTSGAEREQLAALLAAKPWPSVLKHLATSPDVPDDAKPSLVSAALAAANIHAAYKLPAAVSEFVRTKYALMGAFTEPLQEDAGVKVVLMLGRLGVRLDDLEPLDESMRALVVERNLYILNGPNLRIALGVDGEVSLDVVADNEVVYEHCQANLSEYLQAVDQDAMTDSAVRLPETLEKVLNDDVWHVIEEPLAGHLKGLLSRAAQSARIPKLRLVPSEMWEALAEAKLFDATVANVARYNSTFGVDAALAGLLEAAGTIADDGDLDDAGQAFDADAVAVAVLNATTFSSAKARADLASTLNADFPLAVSELVITPDDLSRRLLNLGLVADNVTSFEHFHAAGWEPVKHAIKASSNIETILNPDLTRDMVDKVLADPVGREKLGAQIVANVEAFIPQEDAPALLAVAQYADVNRVSLRPQTVMRIATVEPTQLALVLRLLANAAPAATSPQILEVFARLGGTYAKFGQSGARFDVSDDPLHTTLLTSLKQDGLITSRRKTIKKVYGVTVR